VATDPALAYDRLLIGSPLRRTPVAIAVALVLAGLIALVVQNFLGMLAGMGGDLALVFFAALAAASAFSVVPIAILWYLDRRERETPWLFAAAFLWGAFIATGLAIPANAAVFTVIENWVARNPVIEQVLGEEATLLIVAPIAGPLVEEVTKGLGLLLLFWFLRAEFDGMRDGFVYGALIGAGFTWLEAPLYVAQGYAEFGTAPWGLQLGWRYALFGLSGHAMFTGLFGAFLGLALQTRRTWLKWLAPLAGMGLAIAAHALNNVIPLLFALADAEAGRAPAPKEPPPDIGLVTAWLQGSLADLTLFLPFTALMAFLLWRSGRWEREVIREELADEVDPIVSRAEYVAIRGDRMFRTRRIDRLDPRHSAAIVEAQHELAFRKRRVKDEGANPEADRLVNAWRTEIERLRSLEHLRA
jgi:RsiW-degrading membrane proteinase PrsW (M82 family)